MADAPAGEPFWQLRPDLEIIETESADGGPTLLVRDPVSGNFDRVEWPESDLVRLLAEPMRVEDLRAAFSRRSPLRPTAEDVAGYVLELGKRGWLRGSVFWPRAFVRRSGPGWTAVFARLLFFQVPLLRPAAFLQATAWLARLLINRLTLAFFLLVGLAGLYLALPRWEDYWRDSLGGFDLRRAPAFLLALILVKTVHEFSHAYVATLSGARVASMGVAFFFFMPLPFTDVTDAWRLTWSRRLRVAAAGMAAEMVIAGAALLLWALSPPGDAAVALARLSSVALVSTLLTNLNPGPRFDGYYVLTCLLRTENLRPRAMADLRRSLWGSLFGIELPDAEAGTPGRRRRAMRLYAIYALFYRVSLGGALALMAYTMFPKALGIPVAALELWFFFGYPVMGEIGLFMRNIRAMRMTLAIFLFVVLAVLAGVWFFGEWPRRLEFPAVTRAATEEAVRTGRSGVLLSVAARRGEQVAAGDELARLGSAEDAPLLRRAEWALAEAELSEEQSWRGAARRDSARRGAEVERRRVELDALAQRSGYLSVSAPSDGVLASWDASAVPGVSVGRGRLLGWLVNPPVKALSSYAPPDMASRLELGTRVRFYPDSGENPIFGIVKRIDESRPEVLEDAALAPALGAVRAAGGFLLPVPYVRVWIGLEEEAPRIGQTGRILTWSRPESLASRTWLWLKALAVRESAF